jgi:hypothetical protein
LVDLIKRAEISGNGGGNIVGGGIRLLSPGLTARRHLAPVCSPSV